MTPTIILNGGCIPNDAPELASVVSVVDGDTIKVNIKGEIFTVRYIGIDTPETVHPSKPVEYLGKEASDMNEELVLGKDIFLYKDVSETDQYGRLLRYVVVDGLFVNDELVRRGYAMASTYPPDVACAESLRAAQNMAADQELGLWAPQVGATPTLPGADNVDTDIEITYIFYDGTVSQQEPDEYVKIKNNGSSSINLQGWTLNDESGKTFTFPSHVIDPGQVCHIYTNQDHPETCGFNWQFTSSAIWNNSGDCAVLKNDKREVVDEYCY